MHIFDEADTLKQGKQKLLFFFDKAGDSHLDSHTHGGELYERCMARSPTVLIIFFLMNTLFQIC